MNKQKAKADLPKSIRAKANSPILLVASDSRILPELLDGLSTLNLTVVPLRENMDTYEKLLWASDMMLVLSENPDKYLHDAWRNGVIPVVASDAEGAENYNPVKETGNSFTFNNDDHWGIFAAIVRALETYRFPHDWAHLIAQAREEV
ncbi:MAG: hypothetical protein ABH856_00045 [Patescibacteria group bacterium]|nr:hypothetical protein [Patescibacteria group bacterium]